MAGSAMQRFHSLFGAMLGRSPAIESRTHRDDDIVQIANDVIRQLRLIDHENPSPLRSERSLEVLEAESSKTLTVFDNDDAGIFAVKHFQQARSLSIQPRASLRHFVRAICNCCCCA